MWIAGGPRSPVQALGKALRVFRKVGAPVPDRISQGEETRKEIERGREEASSTGPSSSSSPWSAASSSGSKGGGSWLTSSALLRGGSQRLRRM